MKKLLVSGLFLMLSPILAENRPGRDSDDRKEPVTTRFQNCPSGKKFVCDIEKDQAAGLTKRRCRCIPVNEL